MTGAEGQAQTMVLRVTWWSAVVLLAIHTIFWPGLLAHPSTHLGSEDGTSANLHWVPIALIAWLIIGSRMIAASRTVDPHTNGAIGVMRNAVSGCTAILTLIVLVALVIVGIAALAWATGELLALMHD